MPQAGWFRVHDAFVTDSKLSGLIEAGRHDAVVLYLAAIAHSHIHDTDGLIDYAARQMLERVTCTSSDAFEQLVKADLFTARQARRSRARTYVINGYLNWQTSADQRQEHARIMRATRARDTPKPNHVIDRLEREEREEKSSLSTRARAEAARARTEEREIAHTITQLTDRFQLPKDNP